MKRFTWGIVFIASLLLSSCGGGGGVVILPLTASKTGAQVVVLDAQGNAAFTITLYADGGAGQFSWTVTSGSLPQGLILCGGQPSNRTVRDCSVSGQVTDSGDMVSLASPGGRVIAIQVTDSETPPKSAAVTLTLKAYFQITPGVHIYGDQTLLYNDWGRSVQGGLTGFDGSADKVCWGFLGSVAAPTGLYIYGRASYSDGLVTLYISYPTWPLALQQSIPGVASWYTKPDGQPNGPPTGQLSGTLYIGQYLTENGKIFVTYRGTLSSAGATAYLYTRTPVFNDLNTSQLNQADGVTVDYDATLCPARASVP